MSGTHRILAACTLLGFASTGAAAPPGAYADCTAASTTFDASRLKQAILAEARPRRTAAASFFQDNTVVVAPASLRSGATDLIAYVAGPGVCGSGGCNAYLFEGGSYRALARISPARLPVRALDQRHHGRRDIGVPASGGGIRKGYVGALAFDGRRYASNPTLAGVPHVAPAAGRVLIGLPGSTPGQCRLR